MTQIKTIASSDAKGLDKEVNKFLKENDDKIEKVEDIKFDDNGISMSAKIIFKVKEESK